MAYGLLSREQVAALFVDVERGPYRGRSGVVPFGVQEDARGYRGRAPVVAHPACGSYGKFWWRYSGKEGGPECAVDAVRAVRSYGGVLEHPAQSGLWPTASSRRPGRVGPVEDLPLPGAGLDRYGGWTLAVNQVDWGHAALKPTWLYIVGVSEAELPPRPPPGKPTREVVTKGRARGALPELPKSQRHLTPPAFADWLLEVARRSR